MKIAKADLHIHTKHSFDGVAEPGDIVKAARKAGLSVIAITDHNKIEGALETKSAADKHEDLEVIIGEEVYTGEGEIIGLFLNNRIPPKNGLLETISEIQRQGGIVLVPHPFNWTTLKETITVKKMRKIYEVVDAIEIINPSFFGRRGRRKAPRLNEFYGLAEVGSSDAHHHKQIGHAYTYFTGSSADDLASCIHSRETEAGFESLQSSYELLSVVTQNLKKFGKKGVRKARNTNIRIYE